jgi:hypothetical protein
MHQLNVPLGDLLRKRSMHAKFYEFIMHREGDIDLSFISFSISPFMNLSCTEKEILIYHLFHSLKFVD